MKNNDDKHFGDFTELDVWKLSHELRTKVYILAKFLPEDEKYGIISQIKRSSTSIGANIAEGHGRFHYQENIQFCRQARGSLTETKDHLIFIKDAQLIKKISSIEHLLDLCEQIRIKLNGYIGYLKRCKQEDV
jgi:four helix bundle protein